MRGNTWNPKDDSDGNDWSKVEKAWKAGIKNRGLPEVTSYFSSECRFRYLTDKKDALMKRLEILREGMMLDDTRDGEFLLMSTYEDVVKEIEKINKSISCLVIFNSKREDVHKERISKARDIKLFSYLESVPGKDVVCPFHDDKNPSMRLYPNGRGHCFSCGENTDTIGYVQKMNGLSFLDAIRKLTC